MTETINPELTRVLQHLYSNDEAARALLDVMAARVQDRKETSFERAALLANIEVSEAGRVLTYLAKEGAGKIRMGRHGYKTRILWDLNQRSLAEVARGDASELKLVDPHGPKEPKSGDDGPLPEGVTLIEHRYHLRGKLTVTFALPSDLNQKDVERLTAYLKTLPFDT